MLSRYLWLLRETPFLYDPTSPPGTEGDGEGDGERVVEEVTPEVDSEGNDAATDGDHMARSYDDLARRDRELTQRHQQVRQQEQDLRELAELRRLAREAPQQVLQRLQINPVSLGESLFGTPEQAPENDIGAIRKELQDLRQWREQREQQDQMREESGRIRGAIDGGGYDMLKMAVAENPDQVTREVLQEAHAIYRETGAIPNYADILSKLEDRYTNNALALIQRLSSATKVKERLSGATPAKETAPAKETRQRGIRSRPSPQTLTNDLEESPTESRQLLGTDPQGLEERRKAFLGHVPKLFKER
jgi:hypothetical protein